MRWRFVALLALSASLALSIAPSSAFELASVTRSVGADIVATTSAYSTFTIVQCDALTQIALTCSGNSVANEGNVALNYQLYEEMDPSEKVESYGMASGTRVTSGWTTATADIAVDSSATLDLRIVACAVGCSDSYYYTNWTVQGQKAGTLDFTATRIMIVIKYP